MHCEYLQNKLVVVAGEHIRLVSIGCGECKFGVAKACALLPLCSDFDDGI